MNCLDCEYDLRGLPKGVCPECGRAFDPLDVATFANPRRGWPFEDPRALSTLLVTTCVPPLLHILVGYAALIAARATLGRWPERFGRDDPKDIGWAVSGLMACWYILVLLLFPAFAFCVGALIGTPGLKRRKLSIGDNEGTWQRLNLSIGATVVTWLVFLAHSVTDPARVNVWLLD